MKEYFQKRSVDDVYVSCLKKKRVRNAEGWEKLETVERKVRPSGCYLLDAVVQVIDFEQKWTPREIAGAMEVEAKELSGAVNILTGMPLEAFVAAYRLKRAEELLSCTDLPLDTVASRCGFSSVKTLSQFFFRRRGTRPLAFREKRRPNDFRYRYEW